MTNDSPSDSKASVATAAPIGPEIVSTRSTTSSDGTTIGWEVLGDGPPVLLIHGTLSDGSIWRHLAERLRHNFELHLMDRRGRRLSGSGNSAHSLTREVDDVVAVTAAIGGDVTLCGSSSGAVLCMEAALLTRPSKLVLYEPPLPITEPIYPVGFVDNYQQLLQTGDRDHAATEFLLMVIGDATAVTAMRSQQALWDRLVALTDTALHEIRSLDAYRFDADRIACIDAPTLVVTGEATIAKWREPMYALAEILPRARLQLLAGQGHLAMLTDPTSLAARLSAFLYDDSSTRACPHRAERRRRPR